MTASLKYFEDKFWKILVTLDGLNQDVSMAELLHHFGPHTEEKDIIEVITFMRKFQYPLAAQKKEGANWVCLNGRKPRVAMELSFAEWLAMQSQFPGLEAGLKQKNDRSVLQTLCDKLSLVEIANDRLDLYRVLEEERVYQDIQDNIPEERKEILHYLNEAAINGHVVDLSLQESQSLKAFPHKVVFLDGVLSLVAEDVNDRCMICLEFDQIQGLQPQFDHHYRPNFVTAEVDDFVMAIRSITGNEERLVLKVSSPEKVNLNPRYHFLGSPFVTTNTEGEFIWAASVEVSPELFSWLSSIKDEIEILDPQEVKEQFHQFLEGEEQVPLKKAS